jgi:hypothetical protein
VAFIGKDELLRTEVGIDEVLEFFTILFILLQNGPRDLHANIVSSIGNDKIKRDTPFSWYNPLVEGFARWFALTLQHCSLPEAHSAARQGSCQAGV